MYKATFNKNNASPYWNVNCQHRQFNSTPPSAHRETLINITIVCYQVLHQFVLEIYITLNDIVLPVTYIDIIKCVA